MSRLDMCQSYSMKAEGAPSILRPWISLYRATPKVNIPGTDVDLHWSLRCAAAFSILRLASRYGLYWCGWTVGDKGTYFATSCMVSLVHSTLMLPALAALLRSQKYVPSGKMEGSPRWYEDATNSVIGFCTGYMIYDAILGYIVETWQPGVGPVLSEEYFSYLVHHILTLLYMTSARWNKAGHMSAMILMFNGEFSAPIMNVHLFLKEALQQECWKGIAWLPALFAYNEQVFSVVYLLCRVAVSPFVIGHVSYQLLLTKRGRSEVPLWLSICWMPMCWGVQFGSIPWIFDCFETLKKGPAGMHGEL